MNKDVRGIVWERCEGYCEWCGLPLDPEDWDFHHRQLVTKLDLVPNGIAGHHPCHVIAPKSIHQNPKIARERGFIISQYEPIPFSQVPLLLFGGIKPSRGRWVLLTEDGKYAKVA